MGVALKRENLQTSRLSGRGLKLRCQVGVIFKSENFKAPGQVIVAFKKVVDGKQLVHSFLTLKGGHVAINTTESAVDSSICST